MSRSWAGAALMAATLALAGACRGGGRGPFLTFFNADHLVSVRYPAAWTTEEASQEGVWYRYFQAPPAGPERKPAVTVTLLAGAMTGTLDEYARNYLAAHRVEGVNDASRQGAAGRAWRFVSSDGATRFSLMLLQDAGHVWGLFAQGAAATFDEHREAVEEMEKTLTLERPQLYPEHRHDQQGFALRVPESWQKGQTFSGGGTYLAQFISPALAADKQQLVHASLTVTVEPAQGGLDAFHKSVRGRLGEGYKTLSFVPWRGGYVEMMRAEMPLGVSRVKRYFWTSPARGYSLSCEAREEAFPRVTRWCDVIASTLQIEGQPLAAEPRPTISPTPPPALMAR